MRLLAWTMLCTLVLATTAFAATNVERRVALVIGNGAYLHTTALPNAPNDGRAIATKLRALDFEVLEGIDLDRRNTEELIQQFARRLRGADVGLFFYAGHGLQVNGSNYIVPVDAMLEDESDLDFEAVRLDIVLAQLERQPRTNIVLMDACRDNPLARTLSRSMGASRSAAIGRGLARIDGSIGTLIAYATEPDNVALDGDGANSPFTEALLAHIDTPGLEVRQMLTRVRQQVIAATDRQQVPWDHSSLTGDFFFQASAPAPDAPPVQIATLPQTPVTGPAPSNNDGAAELIMWETVQNITVPEQQIAALNLYVETYPQGRFARLAEIQIASLAAPEPTPVSPPAQIAPDVPRGPVAPSPAETEQLLRLNRDDRRAVQSALTMLGYDTNGVDGVFGGNTRRALRNYQQARGQQVTGYLTRESLAALAAAAEVTGGSANTCQWAFDGECDEARFQGNATEACTDGSDTFDCQGHSLRQSVGAGDSCEWARDGECDDARYVGNASGACTAGTDTTDCRGYALRSAQADPTNSCQWAYDGECDEERFQGAATSACSDGTDSADCRGYTLVGGGRNDNSNSCEWAFDGECDDARYRGNASAACAAGTDAADCRGLSLR